MGIRGEGPAFQGQSHIDYVARDRPGKGNHGNHKPPFSRVPPDQLAAAWRKQAQQLRKDAETEACKLEAAATKLEADAAKRELVEQALDAEYGPRLETTR